MRLPSILHFIVTSLVVVTPFKAVLGQLYNGQTLQVSNLVDITQDIHPGMIVILGENHGLSAHRDQHMAILNQLRNQGLKVSVGLEFVNYTDQSFVDQYRANQLTDDQFLSAIKWGGISYEFYKPQLIFPNVANGEYSLGLNLPRSVSSKISKNGLSSLTEADLLLMPPNFTLGRDSYKNRFAEAAGVHCPSLDNCFAAQSAWDDTMAWQATQFISQHPNQVLVIVVGEFHVQFGGGLPYRIKQRLPGVELRTLSQVWAEGLTDQEIQDQLQPSTEEGPRADFIWVSKP